MDVFSRISSKLTSIDWLLLSATLPLLAAGLITMNTFTSDNYFADRQFLWIILSIAVFFLFSFIDWRFLRRTAVVLLIYLLGIVLLLGLLLFTPVTHGVQSWINLGPISFQPADFFKIVLIITLAKYFSRRHMEIAHYRHILVSGFYALLPFTLVILQPDLGTGSIIFFIWLGMIAVSGVSKKHLLAVFALTLLSFAVAWFFLFAPYQKDRIFTFLDPLRDVRGAGYNAFQSTIAVGSGGLVGKGVGYGTQSRLEFLPEYETDFIFASFAEEWGFIGSLILFVLFAILIWRVLLTALRGATNFEVLFGVGVAIFLVSHFAVNVGMNIAILPVTGVTLPFLSYGGSHLLAGFAALGILMGMRRYSLAVHKDDSQKEYLGWA
jgi:rod shape determining protein RodA